MTAMPKVLPGHKLTLRDRLSHLTFEQACKMLGPDGRKLIQNNANVFPIPLEDVFLGDDLLSVRVEEKPGEPPVFVTFTLMADSRNNIHVHCNRCGRGCEHLGAVMSLVLEQKTALGLAAKPPEREPVANLGEDDLVALAIQERALRAKEEKMAIKLEDDATPWTVYAVTNKLSGKTWLVNLRGFEPGDSFCNCPDFRTNTLGTCKHVIRVVAFAKKRFPPEKLKRRYKPKEFALHLHYGDEIDLRLQVPEKMADASAKIAAPLIGKPIDDYHNLLKRVRTLEATGERVMIPPDVEEYIQQKLIGEQLAAGTAAIRRDPANHELRLSLLKVPLLPYQLDGIAFAAGAGRAILADGMGLGKTIQGVGMAKCSPRSPPAAAMSRAAVSASPPSPRRPRATCMSSSSISPACRAWLCSRN